jgi:two-component system NtrC family sensor kinase
VKISYKLILAVALVSVTIIGVFSYILINSQHRALISGVGHNAHQLSETIKSGTRYDMLLNQPERLHRTIDTIGEQDGIEEVRIFNKEGEIIYSSDRTAVSRMVDKQAEACYACHAADRPLERLSINERTRIFAMADGTRRLGIINPIYNQASCWEASCHAHEADQTVLGVLDVTMSLAEVDEQMRASRSRVALFATTAVIAVSFIIWLSFEILVGKPVKRLVKATNLVAEGDLTFKLDVKRNDELGRLANSFDGMTHRLVEIQQQLYQADKLASLGRLAAGVAHEINNPLTGVLTYSSFLAKRARDNPEMAEDLDTIVRETKRCRQIVKGLLDFSRQVPARTTDVDLDEVVSQSLKIVNNRLSFDNISVKKTIPPDLPPIKADLNQMVQVFINLFVNAADAIGRQGGEISVTARPHETNGKEMVEIKVADSGCGVSPEEVSKVFEPFYTTKDGEGTGLGLAIVWGIVDKHGGTIDLVSEVNVGTTMTLRLPVGPGAAIARAS